MKFDSFAVFIMGLKGGEGLCFSSGESIELEASDQC